MHTDVTENTSVSILGLDSNITIDSLTTNSYIFHDSDIARIIQMNHKYESS